jgi:hypothetical protein
MPALQDRQRGHQARQPRVIDPDLVAFLVVATALTVVSGGWARCYVGRGYGARWKVSRACC